MVYPRISGDKVIPRLSGVLKILKVMDHAYGAYVLQSEVRVQYEMAVPVSASDSLTVPTSMGAALSAYDANGRES